MLVPSGHTAQCLALCADMLAGMATDFGEVKHGMTAGIQIMLRSGFTQLLECAIRVFPKAPATDHVCLCLCMGQRRNCRMQYS